MKKKFKIRPCVVGLGYVGLPVFQMLSRNFTTCGYDIDKKRIEDLKNRIDKNLDLSSKDFNLKFNSFFTSEHRKLSEFNFFIVTVPTPIFINKKPNLNFIRMSFETISKYIKKKDIIILESTVFPGVTENFCKKILNNNKKKLVADKDFFVGYSPERVNPGDEKHNLKNINKNNFKYLF